MQDTATQLSPEGYDKPLTPWLQIDDDPQPPPGPTPSMRKDLALLNVGQSALVVTKKMPRIYGYAKSLGIKIRSAKAGPNNPGKTRIWRLE